MQPDGISSGPPRPRRGRRWRRRGTLGSPLTGAGAAVTATVAGAAPASTTLVPATATPMLAGQRVGVDLQPHRRRTDLPARGRRDGRRRPGRPGRGVRPRARLPRQRPGRRHREGDRHRPAHRHPGLRHLRRRRRPDGRRSSPRPASTRWSSTSRTSAPASTPTSGRCTTAWSPRPLAGCGSSCSTGPTRSAAAAHGPVMTPARPPRVGRKAIVQQHGMTVGELAGLLQRRVPARGPRRGRPVDLARVAREGLARDDLYAGETGLPWVMPSARTCPPPDTALVYPGTCLFEAHQPVRGARHDPARSS